MLSEIDNQEDRGDSFPIFSTEDEEDLKKEEFPEILPILPVKNTVLFPGVVMPITVGRQRSVKLVKKAYKGDRIIGVLTQTNEAEEPTFDDMFPVGVVAVILKMIVMPDGSTTIIIQGRKKFEILERIQVDPHMSAKVMYLNDSFPSKSKKEVKAIIQALRDNSRKILQMNPEIPRDAQIAIDNISSPNFLTHFLASNLSSSTIEEKQDLLITLDGLERAHKVLAFLMKELQMLELKHEIQNKAHNDIDAQQRDYFLRQQIKVLQDELGMENTEKDIEKLRLRGAQKKWPEEVAKHFFKELDKLNRINPMSAEYPVQMNFVEFLVDLPWNDYTKDNFNLKRAKKILDADHSGLEKVKDRILEYLAVLKMKNNMKAPILCLYGPPGVGKTSLGRSIAKCLGRKYVRLSLGGLHDEAEIRGHRKTYIGAMPGKIIQQIKKVESSNPVFVLDEIDKIGRDFRGDPSSALLEVLDPEQNSNFADNYLEVDYDLSKILFLATSNSLDTIQPALRDRMEIIEINGYTLEEKVQIAKKHLIPKQLVEHGLAHDQIAFDMKAIEKLIDGYTRESGVRSLERKIGEVVRKVVKKIAMEEEAPDKITAADVEKLIGAPHFEKETYTEENTAGVVTGLAWTSVGGEILFIESSLNKGKGRMILSGQLGDVMKESATAALSYLKAHASEYGIDYRVFDQFDLHIHVPAGAVPKDGPSAGITMLTSLASVFTQRKVKPKLAMTGEITLRGKVLPVGGIQEKVLAAKRAGIKHIMMCVQNKKDVDEMQADYRKGLEFHFVSSAEEVLEYALLKEKVKKPVDLSIENDVKS
ncbi:MAG TPA: endopeptidase La [Catalimonadaceae bacterium]|nr:endopeptidase La [Catalimonadaceae bacterium]